MEAPGTIYTIGHSTRDADEFLGLLQAYDIGLLVDVRSLPGSRKYPHFDKEQLEISLPANGIRYLHLPALGGRRKAAKDSPNTAWRHPAFRGYADYMESVEFAEAFSELELLASELPTAYMCSEAVWWRCHRAMISDQLKLNGWTVLHIISPTKADKHPYTSPAKIIDGQLSYEGE